MLLKFERKELSGRIMGIIAFTWAICVHTGTGMIMGFVYAKSLYYSPLHGVIFVASAITSGIGGIILMIYLTFKYTNRPFPVDVARYLAKIMGVGAAVIGYLMLAEILTILYHPHKYPGGMFMFFQGFWFFMYWILFFIIGIIIPIIIIWNPKKSIRFSLPWLSFAGILHVIGIWAERYIVVVPGLLYPEELLPGYRVVYPELYRGIIAYWPSPHEWLMFIGIVAAVLFLYALGIKFLAILPERVEGFE
jgi:molybdopterin-containing oxidoreductase family membrane subunit